jgi:ABC-type multidrug transport system ATPase subunit
MGPSGSGKTTLLDVLAGRKTAGTTSGTLLFGGTVPTRAFMRRFSAYVEQFDTLLGILTVEEMARSEGCLLSLFVCAPCDSRSLRLLAH